MTQDVDLKESIEAVAKCARAAYEADRKHEVEANDLPWDELPPSRRKVYVDVATAVIETMQDFAVAYPKAMDAEIETGSVVELKSGGPRMTVSTLRGSHGNPPTSATCNWFDNGDELRGGEFTLSSIRLVQD
jgi:uncharacterized protein YodC (DUF2158 family)